MAAPDYDPRLSVEGSGEPLVLVPGMDGTGQLFYRQVPLLARSFRTATYALRNDAPTMDTLVDDLGRVIDTIAPQTRGAVVVGESFGGALAMSFALARPEQVSALVVLNSFPYFAPQFRLRLARYGLGVIPWGAMSLIRRATAFRLHSAHTHRDEIRRFMELTAAASFYFTHSYYAGPADRSIVAATADYGLDYACAVEHGRVAAVQFHPEKSGANGLRVLESFLSL